MKNIGQLIRDAGSNPAVLPHFYGGCSLIEKYGNQIPRCRFESGQSPQINCDDIQWNHLLTKNFGFA